MADDRFRCIPMRAPRSCPSWYAHDEDEARGRAERFFAETGIPVLVVLAPAGGLVTRRYVVGDVKVGRR